MIDDKRANEQGLVVASKDEPSELAKLRFENQALRAQLATRDAQLQTLRRTLESSLSVYNKLAQEFRQLREASWI